MVGITAPQKDWSRDGITISLAKAGKNLHKLPVLPLADSGRRSILEMYKNTPPILELGFKA
jgi:hypothetical protein